ncbi:MAG: MotE family protein [Hyphomonadaceae bacterium]
MKTPKPAPARRRFALGGRVRLLPTVMVTAVAVLGVKAVAVAQSATEASPVAPGASPAPSAAPARAPARPAAQAQQQCAAPSFAEQAGLSQSEVQVLQALGSRRDALDARSADLDTRAELLSAAERRLNERLTELRRLETSVNDLLGRLDESQETRMNSLVDVYQRMRAKDAAEVFDALDDETLILVASRMRQQNLAEVMGRMQVPRARRLTQLLAERTMSAADAEALLARARAAAPAAPEN